MQNIKYCELFKKFNKSFDPIQIKCACVFLKNEAIIVDKEENVYHLVNNGSTKIDKLCKKGVIDFAYSYSVVKNVFGYHILCLTNTGRVYGWGRNTFKQVSLSDKEEILFPERLKITKGPVPARVAKSPLTELNDTYHCCSCWPDCAQFKSDQYEKFKLIGCGFGHCVAVTEQNNIIVWGNNKLGQIGNDEKIIRGNPNIKTHKIIVMDEAIEPSCGFVDSFKAYSLFFTQYMPSLLPIKRFKQVNIPKKIEIKERDPEIISIACGSFHSLVLFRSGNLYGWGDNRYGQLGNSSKQAILSPMLINSNVKQMASTNLYTLVLTHEGVVYAMGDNTYAQLGNNKQVMYQEPIEIPKLKFAKIATINQLSIGLTKDDKCYIWGLYKMIKQHKNVKSPNQEIQENNEGQRPTPMKRSNGRVGQFLGAAAILAPTIAIDAIIRSNKSDDNNEQIQEVQENNPTIEEIEEEGDEEIISEGQDQEEEENDQREVDKDKEEVENEEEESERADQTHCNHNQFVSDLKESAVMGLAFGLASSGQNNETEEDYEEEEPEQDTWDTQEDEADVEKLTYIIKNPTQIECKSFEKIIAKVLSLTNSSIKFDEQNYDLNENDVREIIDLKILTEKRTGISSELKRNVKVLGQQLRKVGGNKVKVFFGDHNKFSVFSDSYVLPQGDLTISDIKQTGKSMFDLNKFKGGDFIN